MGQAQIYEANSPQAQGMTELTYELNEKLRRHLTAAIQGKATLRIDYAPGARVIEPHCLGVSIDGNLLLRAYQTEGASLESEQPIGWKLFRIDMMGPTPEVIGRFEASRPGYKRGDRAMRGGVIAEL